MAALKEDNREPMIDTSPSIKALRTSHDRFVALVEPLLDAGVQRPSYASEWSIAQVASHLGSQAEIFQLFLDAGLTDGLAPGGEVFPPIWDRWNALPPARQVTRSIVANEQFVTRVERLELDHRDGLRVAVSGTELDLAGLALLRLGEHAVHTWDVAVTLDPDTTIAADAVRLLIDQLPSLAARTGQPVAGRASLQILTDEPQRRFRLQLAPEVALVNEEGAPSPSEWRLQMPAEALIRLIYGRLDAGHTPGGITAEKVGDHGMSDGSHDASHLLRQLRHVFPGF